MIESNRLILVPLRYDQLVLYKNDYLKLCESLGASPQEFLHDASVVADVVEATEFWLASTQRYPSHFEWYTNWVMIEKTSRLIVGGVGFAGFPNEQGKSMIGYGLDTRFFGKGFASEAVGRMIEWAFTNPSMKAIIAETPIGNVASQKVLLKNGFAEVARSEVSVQWELSRG